MRVGRWAVVTESDAAPRTAPDSRPGMPER